MPGGTLRQLTFGINFGIRDNELRQSNQQVDLLKRNVNQSSGALAGLGATAITVGRNMKTAFAGALRVLERYKYYVYGAFMAVGGAIAGTTKIAGDFQYQITRTGQVARATAGEIELLTKNAKQLGIDTAFTAKEAAEGQELLARAGFGVQEIMTTIPAVLDAAAIEEMELSEASKIVGQTVRTMGYEVDQSRRIIDVLARTSQKSMTNVQELGSALPNVAGDAGRLGISIEELSGALGLLADRGEIGSRAGERLRGVIQSLISPSTQAKSAIEEMGVELWDEGKLKSLTGIVEEFEGVLSGLTAEEREARIGEIFSGRRAATFGKLLDAGSEGLVEFTGILENAGGTAEKMAEEQLDTLRGSIKRLRGSVNVAAINIGEFFVPTISNAIDSVTGLINVFNEAPPATQKLVGGTLAISAGLLGTLAAVLLLKKPVLLLVGAFKAIGAVLGVTASGVLIAIGVITGLYLIFEDLYYSMEKNREGVLVPLIDSFFDLIGIGYDFQDVWDEGKDIMNAFFVGLGLILSSVYNMARGLGKMIVGFFTFDEDMLLEGWKNFEMGFGQLVDGVYFAFWSFIGGIAKGAYVLGEIILKSLAMLVGGAVVGIVNSINWMAENAWNNIVDFVEDLTGIQLPKIDIPTIDEAIQKVKDEWNDFKKWWSDEGILSIDIPDWMKGWFGISDDNNPNNNVQPKSGKQDVNVKVTPSGGTGGTTINRRNNQSKVEQNIEIPIEVNEAENGTETGRKVRDELKKAFQIIESEEGLGGESL